MSFEALVRACKYGCLDDVKRITKFSNSVNGFSLRGVTPLYSSCDGGHLDVVKFLVENKNANVGLRNGKKSWERSPLHIASSKGYARIVQYLIGNGANVFSKDSFQKTPLDITKDTSVQYILKSEMEKHSKVKFIFKKSQKSEEFEISIRQKIIDRERKLDFNKQIFSLCKSGDVEKLHSILSGRKDKATLLNAISTFKKTRGHTPLSIACCYNRLKMVTYLVNEMGVLVNKRVGSTLWSRTPLMFASERNNIKMVKFLLHNDAKVDLMDDFGSTAIETCKGRIRRKSSAEMFSKPSKSLGRYSRRKLSQSVLDVSGKVKNDNETELKIRELLLSHSKRYRCKKRMNKEGKEVSEYFLKRRSHKGRLRSAVSAFGLSSSLKKRKNEFDLNIRLSGVKKKYTVTKSKKEIEKKEFQMRLVELCKRGKVHEIRHYINSKKLSVDFINENLLFKGFTPLIMACFSCRYDIVKYLIKECKADINFRAGNNLWRRTALMFAVEKKSVKICEFLMSNGADKYAKDNFGKSVFTIAKDSKIYDLCLNFGEIEKKKSLCKVVSLVDLDDLLEYEEELADITY